MDREDVSSDLHSSVLGHFLFDENLLQSLSLLPLPAL